MSNPTTMTCANCHRESCPATRQHWTGSDTFEAVADCERARALRAEAQLAEIRAAVLTRCTPGTCDEMSVTELVAFAVRRWADWAETTKKLDAVHAAAEARAEAVKVERDAARETNRRLNRRVQAAEGDVAAFRYFVEHDATAAVYFRRCPQYAPIAAASALVADWVARGERATVEAAMADGMGSTIGIIQRICEDPRNEFPEHRGRTIEELARLIVDLCSCAEVVAWRTARGR